MKTFYIMGRSGVGKDTVVKELMKKMKEEKQNIKEIVIYTTRPMREGETNGKEYIFISDKEFEKMRDSGQFIESRDYHTERGIWKYGTKIDALDSNEDYLLIGTPAAYQKIQEKGIKNIYPILIEADESYLMNRVMGREKNCSSKSTEEMKRRFAADKIDFCEERLKTIEGLKRIKNESSKEACVSELYKYIQDIRSLRKNSTLDLSNMTLPNEED